MSKHGRSPSSRKGAQPEGRQDLGDCSQVEDKPVMIHGETPSQQAKMDNISRVPDSYGSAGYPGRSDPGMVEPQLHAVAEGSELDEDDNVREAPRADPRCSTGFAELVEQFALDRNAAIAAIRKGLPASVLKEASEYFEVPLSTIRTIVRVPESTAARLVQKQAGVDPAVSERIWRLADVMHMAIDVFEDVSAAKSWLRSPHRTFMNSAPMDYLDTEPGAMSVRQVLNAIATGGAA